MTDESPRPGLYVGRFYLGRVGLVAYLAVSLFVIAAGVSDLLGVSNSTRLSIIGATVLAAPLVVAIGAWRAGSSDNEG